TPRPVRPSSSWSRSWGTPRARWSGASTPAWGVRLRPRRRLASPRSSERRGRAGSLLGKGARAGRVARLGVDPPAKRFGLFRRLHPDARRRPVHVADDHRGALLNAHVPSALFDVVPDLDVPGDPTRFA